MNKNDLDKIINKMTKWRSVFAGWQLGTRDKTDPECQAVRDHREATLMLRAELTAVTRILFEKGICTPEDFILALAKEAFALDVLLEQKFPGFKSSDDGIIMDIEKAKQTMKGWKP